MRREKFGGGNWRDWASVCEGGECRECTLGGFPRWGKKSSVYVKQNSDEVWVHILAQLFFYGMMKTLHIFVASFWLISFWPFLAANVFFLLMSSDYVFPHIFFWTVHDWICVFRIAIFLIWALRDNVTGETDKGISLLGRVGGTVCSDRVGGGREGDRGSRGGDTISCRRFCISTAWPQSDWHPTGSPAHRGADRHQARLLRRKLCASSSLFGFRWVRF